jgi:hypothetical protein
VLPGAARIGYFGDGGMGERLKPAVLKTVNGETRSGVRIPLPPRAAPAFYGHSWAFEQLPTVVRRLSPHSLFMAERDDGIDFHRAPGRDVAGCHREKDQERGDCRKGKRILRPDSEELVRQEPSQK